MSTTVQVTLLISNNFVIDGSYLYFFYEDSTEILSIDPDQGFIGGDVYATISGNFTALYNQVYEVYFGTIQSTNISISLPT